jgi:hypothetical protein
MQQAFMYHVAVCLPYLPAKHLEEGKYSLERQYKNDDFPSSLLRKSARSRITIAKDLIVAI